jgi:hypothetical protein
MVQKGGSSQGLLASIRQYLPSSMRLDTACCGPCAAIASTRHPASGYCGFRVLRQKVRLRVQVQMLWCALLMSGGAHHIAVEAPLGVAVEAPLGVNTQRPRRAYCARVRGGLRA